MKVSSPAGSKMLYRCALVIDDSSVERMLATAVLQKLGFSVACAGSAEDALALLAERRFDLAVCDIALPGMDGLALLSAMRAWKAAPPCIMLSAHDDLQHGLAALRHGAKAYLVKPLRLARMRDAVGAIFPVRQPEPALEAASAVAAMAPIQRAGRLSCNVRRMAAAAAQPVRSAVAALLPAGIGATG